jgi:hypothetical protein
MNDQADRASNTIVHAIWAGALVAVVLIGFLAYRMSVNRIERNARDAVKGATEKAEQYARQLAAFTERAAEKFKTGTITETFAAEVAVFRSAGVGRLELGTSEAVETFRRTNELRLFWDTVSLGQTVSEIRVPVTYRYHVPLDGPWQFRVEGDGCTVIPPPIRPSLPPAIHTDKMEKRTRSGWARFDAAEQMDALERAITPTLVAYASDPAHLAKVRDECRLTVARFIHAWLRREGQWDGDRFRSITVVFPDEPAPAGPPRPTLTYEFEKPLQVPMPEAR